MSSVEKKWILSKYAKLMLKNPNDSSSSYWKTVDSSQCDTPIYIAVKATNYLQINYDNEYLEYVNLWNAKDDLKLYYKDQSFMIVHKMKSFVRKFRVQFLDDSSGVTASKSCEACVNELRKFISVEAYESGDSQAAAKTLQPSIACPRSAPDALKQNENGTCSLKDLTKMLITNNQHKLPMLYANQSAASPDDLKEEKVLEEFIVSCLLDPTFPQFVRKVQCILKKVVADELNPGDG